YLAANHGRSHQFEEYFKQHPIAINRGSLTGRTVLEGKVIHIPDAQSDPEYTMTELIKLDPFRTMLGVPLLREGSPIGVITLTRRWRGHLRSKKSSLSRLSPIRR